MRRYVEDAGRQAVALIFDGLIYLSRTGHPVDPSGIALGEFGILKVTSTPVNDAACEKKPIFLREVPIACFWDSISRGYDSQEAMVIAFDSEACCLPNTLAHLIPAAAQDILEISRNRPGPYRVRDFSRLFTFEKLCRLSDLDAGAYLVIRSHHVFGIRISASPLFCFVSDASSQTECAIPYGRLIGNIISGRMVLNTDYLVVRICHRDAGRIEDDDLITDPFGSIELSATKRGGAKKTKRTKDKNSAGETTPSALCAPGRQEADNSEPVDLPVDFSPIHADEAELSSDSTKKAIAPTPASYRRYQMRFLISPPSCVRGRSLLYAEFARSDRFLKSNNLLITSRHTA